MVAKSVQSLSVPKGKRVVSTLPAVKCSTCGKPVPLDELGDHVCAKTPSEQKPSPSPTLALGIKATEPLKPVAPTPSPTRQIMRALAAASSSKKRPSVDSIKRPSLDRGDTIRPPSTNSSSVHSRSPSRSDHSPVASSMSLVNARQPALTSESMRSQLDSRSQVTKSSTVSVHGVLPPMQTVVTVRPDSRGRSPPPPPSPAMSARPPIQRAESARPSHLNLAPLDLRQRVESSPARSQFQMGAPPGTPIDTRRSPSPTPSMMSMSFPMVETPGNMAGVGRRAFAAAAHAAFFTASHPNDRHEGHGMHHHHPSQSQYLTINTASGRSTPSLSLSLGSPHPSSPSPHSPESRTPSPFVHSQVATSRTPSPANQITLENPDLGKYTSVSAPTAVIANHNIPDADDSPLSPTSPTSSTELAYASYDPPEPPAKDTIAFPRASKSSDSHSRSGSSTSSSSRHTKENGLSSIVGARLNRNNTLGSASVYSSGTAAANPRRLSKSTGAINEYAQRPHLETLNEEEPPAPLVSPLSSPTSPTSPTDPSIKLPTRSQTTPNINGGSSTTGSVRRRSKKKCVQCGKTIEDGRWVAIDGGASGVLCEKDWKEMYLPKCRRCGLTIESQAVSSADGQLKGKYHRDCFNCHTCQKPFPDKSFYVLNGQPYCDYHYHESNNSLCRRPSCGRPIEGPCAEDHEGKRYHPDHLICDEDGCDQILVEYMDIDGRKFCDRHSDHGHSSPRSDRFDIDDPDKDGQATPRAEQTPRHSRGREPTSQAMKRRTRFLEI